MIYNYIKNSETFGYADDFKLANTDPCNLQEYINKIEKWCSDNELKFNSEKMLYTTNQNEMRN